MKFLVGSIWIVLYHTIGYYSAAGEYVDNSSLSNVEIDDVQFYLYTHKNQENPKQLWFNDTQSILKSSFNFNKPTKFVTHGRYNNHLGESTALIRDAFLAQNNYNVITIDWSNISKLSLIEVILKMKHMGLFIAKMADSLVHLRYDPKKIAFIGHSAGAAIVGLAGSQTTYKIGHVVGLDPADKSSIKSMLNNTIPDEEIPRITKNDANLVEVVYTHFGIDEAAGHVNFYPNGGGPEQQVCHENPNVIKCSHELAYRLYAEAIINPNGLIAIKCSDYKSFLAGNCKNNILTYFPNSSNKNKVYGSYYLRTASNSPFGLGLNGIEAK